MKSFKESLLSDQDEIMNNNDEMGEILLWEEKYCDNSHFKRDKHYTISNENGHPTIVPVWDTIDLGRSMGLDKVRIKWPTYITNLHIMYDDYMNAKWWKDNFKNVDVEKLFIDLNLGHNYNPKATCLGFKDVNTLYIDGQSNSHSSIILPAGLRCYKLNIMRAPHVKFPNGELPCEEIRISKTDIIR